MIAVAIAVKTRRSEIVLAIKTPDIFQMIDRLAVDVRRSLEAVTAWLLPPVLAY